NRSRVFTTLCWRPPHSGQTNPSGHRDATTTARHCASVPNWRSNSGSLSPFWNCTVLRAIVILRQTAIVNGLYRISDGGGRWVIRKIIGIGRATLYAALQREAV